MTQLDSKNDFTRIPEGAKPQNILVAHFGPCPGLNEPHNPDQVKTQYYNFALHSHREAFISLTSHCLMRGYTLTAYRKDAL